MALCLCGCSKEYRQQAVGPDSSEGKQVSEMVASLRSVKPSELPVVIAGQSAGGLTDIQADSLRAALGKIAAADAVKLADLSRFGDKIYRAVLDVRTADGTEQVCMLVVGTEGGLRWAGPN